MSLRTTLNFDPAKAQGQRELLYELQSPGFILAEDPTGWNGLQGILFAVNVLGISDEEIARGRSFAAGDVISWRDGATLPPRETQLYVFGAVKAALERAVSNEQMA